VLMPNTEMEGAARVAETIRKNVEKAIIPSIGDASRLSVTVSIGVASTKPTVGSLTTDLMEQADQALYAAKKSGRNKVCS